MYQRAPWSEKAYAAAQGKPCPHHGVEPVLAIDQKTGERFVTERRPLAAHCVECMDGYQATIDKEAEVEDLKRRIARLEAARDQ